MKWVLGICGVAILALAVAVTYGFLAPLVVHLRVAPGEAEAYEASSWERQPFVGLALSGGGARAAVFAAAGIKALHERGKMDEVTHVSSVSGGGFAASYLALNPLPDANGAQTYFKDMFDVMAHDYFWDIQMSQLRHPQRWFSPSRRLISLTEALERPGFLKQAIFSDLPDNRAFFFNAVSYDSGRRFVFSNSALPAPQDTKAKGLLRSLRSQSFSDAKVLRHTPTKTPLSLAVAISAGFPPSLGPVTIQIEDAKEKPLQYWHLGDGGVVEYPGVETLREAIYARSSARAGKIYSFNAGRALNEDKSIKDLDISIWSRDVTRLVDVMNVYAGRHRGALYELLDQQNGADIELIEFDFMEVVRQARSDTPPDPVWLDWTCWENDTAADRAASPTPADHLEEIPTDFKITPINRELIARAAEFLVNQKFPVDKREDAPEC